MKWRLKGVSDSAVEERILAFLLFLPLSALLEKETGKKMAAMEGWRAADVSMLTFADMHFCSLGIRKKSCLQRVRRCLHGI